MKLILIPTDFSPLSDNAMKYGIDMAQTIGAKIMLVNMYQIPISFSDVPLITISVEELKKISDDKLLEIKHNIDTITGGKIHVYIESRLGEVVDEIEKLCDTLHPYAVIMGTRGLSGIGRFFIGSNSLSTIAKVETPVFIIPPGARFKSFKKIGLTTDMRDVEDNIPVGPIREIVNFYNADFHVLNVDYENKHVDSYTTEESLKLSTMISDLNPIYDMIENKSIEEGINEFAEKNNLDLIIAIHKKHYFLENILEKSHTRELIYHTNIPLMCIHQKKEETVAKTQHS